MTEVAIVSPEMGFSIFTIQEKKLLTLNTLRNWAVYIPPFFPKDVSLNVEGFLDLLA